MRTDHHDAGLVVVRSGVESGRFGLRLIGELDLSTIKVFDAQLGDTREQSPPSVIDVSELRFLDLTGLRALRRASQGDGSLDTHLVGATGVVRRIIELARMLDAERTGALAQPLARKPTKQVAADHREAILSSGRPPVAAGLRAASSTLSPAPIPIPGAHQEVNLSSVSS